METSRLFHLENEMTEHSEYWNENRRNPIRPWPELRRDLKNLSYDIGHVLHHEGMAKDLLEYVLEVEEKIEAMRKLVPDPTQFSECW